MPLLDHCFVDAQTVMNNDMMTSLREDTWLTRRWRTQITMHKESTVNPDDDKQDDDEPTRMSKTTMNPKLHTRTQIECKTGHLWNPF